jgi:hypothetical protein
VYLVTRVPAWLFGLALFLFAASGGNTAAEDSTPGGSNTGGGGESVARDILAGWPQTWQWHATPDGKIWRGDGNGPFLDCFAEWGWQRRLEGNHEQQVYVSPSAWKKAGFNCVVYDAATQSLAIRPRVATLAETAITGYTQDVGPYKGHAIFSGMLSLEQLTAACPRNGAWRIVARMPGKGVGGPAYQGAFPAVWLVAHKYPMWDGANGPKRSDPFYEKHWELDIIEQHARDLSHWYVTDPAQAPFNRAPEAPQHLVVTGGDTSRTFHEWITVVTDRWWLVYLDRKLIRKSPKTQSAGHPPLYLIFNLAIGGTWFGNVTSETVFSQWEMNLKSITIYSLPDGFNGDQELPLSTGGGMGKGG